MKIIFIADTHFSSPRRFAYISSSGLNSRFVDQMTVWDTIPKDTDILIHLGDLFHSKIRLDKIIYDKVFEEFAQAPGTHKILICGNHDFYEYNREPSLYPFREIANVCFSRYIPIYIDNVVFHCFPYPASIRNFFEDLDIAVSNISKDKINILLTHIGITEGEVGATNLHLTKDIHLSELRFEEFDYVFLGHYHKHQQLTSNVWYVGSPIQLNFAEREEDKGIMSLDIDDNNNEPEFIKNQLAPSFNVIEIDNMKQLAKLDLDPNNFHKVILNCKVKQSVIEKISKNKKIIIEGGIIEKRESRLKETDNTVDILKEYIDFENPDKKLDRNFLLKSGLEWLKSNQSQ